MKVSVECTYRFKLGGDAAMKRDEFLIDDARKRHGVEVFHNKVVHFLVVLAEHLLAEVEVGSHLAALVVAAQHDDGLREVNFEREEKHQHLH